MILKDVWNDVKHRLKQTMDDRQISDVQGWYWVKVAADSLIWKVLRMQSRLDYNDRSGLYKRRFVLDIVLDDTHCEKYVVLPQKIYDFEVDAGIDVMWYMSAEDDCDNCPPPFSKIKFARTSPGAIPRGQTQSPSASNPYYYRENDRLYLLGLERSPSIKQLGIILFCNLPDIRTIANAGGNMELGLADELLGELVKLCVDNARVMLIIPEEDGTNDGVASMSRVNLPKGVSVNAGNPASEQ